MTNSIPEEQLNPVVGQQDTSLIPKNTRSEGYDLTPKEVITLLDRYIVGQYQAKRCMAVALRNRWRRQQIPQPLRDEIMPKNIIMIGATGVGKTEIARRISKIISAPFIKVEASKYTEVGYVGRDVESMIRELTETSIKMLKEQKKNEVNALAEDKAIWRVVDIMLPSESYQASAATDSQTEYSDNSASREKLYERIKKGVYDEREISFETSSRVGMAAIELFPSGNDNLDMNLQDMMSRFMPQKTQKRKAKIAEAIKLFAAEEAEDIIDKEELQTEAISKVEQDGIIFIDEIDKVATQSDRQSGDISHEGVQRDLLPIVEGSSVNTKYGQVNTDHILFIAAGAFHLAKPSDLIPELQGRFPIRVELDSLKKEDFIRILSEPTNSLIKQYTALLSTEGITLNFSDDSIEEIAELAERVNENTENIGARRLHTLMEKLLEDISFEASECEGSTYQIDREFVHNQLKDISVNRDLSRYIL